MALPLETPVAKGDKLLGNQVLRACPLGALVAMEDVLSNKGLRCAWPNDLILLDNPLPRTTP